MPFRISTTVCCLLALPLLAWLAAIPSGHAAPTGPEGVAVDAQQPDGTVLNLRGYGDEFYCRYETPDGYTVIRDPQTSIWRYADPGPEGLVPGKYVVGRDDPAASGLERHVDVSDAVRAAIIEDSYNRLVVPTNWARRSLENRIVRLHTLGAMEAADRLTELYNARYSAAGWKASLRKDGAPVFSSPDDPAYGPPPPMALTNVVGLCILAKFPDQGNPVASQSDMDNLVNQSGYSGYSNSGSVRDYFYDQSFGKLTYTAIVTPYITANNNRSYYANQNNGMGGRELLRECIGKLAGLGLNLSALTSSGGTAVAVYLLYAGNTSYDGLWPHMSSLSPAATLPGGAQVADYMVSSIGGSPAIGTICHESGHLVLQCMDYYDYGNAARYGGTDTISSAGIGYHCLMSAGNHLNSGRTPAPINAYLKTALGWSGASTLPASGQVSFGANDQTFYRFARPGASTEYFIMENKTKTENKWRAYLPASGLAVWHVDEAVTTYNELQQRTPSQHYELSLEQADGRYDLENSRPGSENYGDSTDYHDGASGRNAFSDSTTPNANWWSGAASGLSLTAISAPGASITSTVAGGGGGGDDHGNNAASSTPIQADGTPVSGVIETGGDVDWFRFSAGAGTCTLQTGGGEDTYLTLYGTDGTTVLDEDDDGGGNLLSLITWDIPAAGTYYASVRLYDNSDTGAYSLAVTAQGGGGGTTGSLTVTILPADAVAAGAQWRVDGGNWQNSGTTAGGLTVGTHQVSFSDVSGWVTPANTTANVLAGQTAGVTGTYTSSAPAIVGMTAGPTRLDFPAASGTQTFRIETTAPWSVSADQFWVTLSPATGAGATSVNVSCAENTGDMRSAVITISGSNTNPGVANVGIVQEAAPKRLCGCFVRKDAKLADTLRELLGDWLLAGVALMTLATLSRSGKTPGK